MYMHVGINDFPRHSHELGVAAAVSQNSVLLLKGQGGEVS